MQNETEELKKLLEENLAITKDTRDLLKKMHRVNVYSFWARILWFAVLVGVPFIVYYFVLEPYLEALGFSSEAFKNNFRNFTGFFQAPWGGSQGE